MIYRLFVPKKGTGKCIDKNNVYIQHDSAWKLIIYALETEYGIEEPEFFYGEYGKPMLKDSDIFFNISHTDGCVAVITGKTAVGIDVEHIRPLNPLLCKKVLSKNEQNFLKNSKEPEKDFIRLWVLKESYIKALGTGISYGLKNIEFSWDDRWNIYSNAENADFKLIMDHPEYVLGACIIKPNIIL